MVNIRALSCRRDNGKTPRTEAEVRDNEMTFQSPLAFLVALFLSGDWRVSQVQYLGKLQLCSLTISSLKIKAFMWKIHIVFEASFIH